MDAETVVVGGGVVGLAIARALTQAGRDVLVVEREGTLGAASSSRNSGVIHAGIYYPTDSLKARLCIRGNALLYDYCARRGVAHRRCGKLLVATTEAEAAVLRHYQQLAASNGVGELKWLNAAEVAELEPEVSCTAALHSPDTGIIDSHELMMALRADIESRGGQIILNTALRRAAAMSTGFLLTLTDPDELALTCRALVNAAGLDAPAVAATVSGPRGIVIPRARYARGHYYALRGPAPFRMLVYPVPDGGGLGIHATPDLSGRIRFGPDVEWIDRVDYRFGAGRVQSFAAAIRRYYPALDEQRLTPDYTGVRPKIYGPGEPPLDFRIDGPAQHGIHGLVHLFGIESPGLTASLAIGEAVARLLANAPSS